MGAFWKWIEARFGGGPGGAKRTRTFQWLLLLGLAGVALMLMNSFISVKKIDPVVPDGPAPNGDNAKQAFSESAQAEKFQTIETKYETAIRDILEKIVGVGQVEVLVTIDSTEEIVVEQQHRDTSQVSQEKDSNGATRQVTDVTRDGQVVMYETSDRGKSPIVLKTIKPQIRGVVVVAKGAENPTVKKLILEAVERGLAVPVTKISVVPRKQQQ